MGKSKSANDNNGPACRRGLREPLEYDPKIVFEFEDVRLRDGMLAP